MTYYLYINLNWIFTNNDLDSQPLFRGIALWTTPCDNRVWDQYRDYYKLLAIAFIASCSQYYTLIWVLGVKVTPEAQWLQVTQSISSCVCNNVTFRPWIYIEMSDENVFSFTLRFCANFVFAVQILWNYMQLWERQAALTAQYFNWSLQLL